MNMISALRREVSQHGQVVITVDMFNQLQGEWITRAGADDIIAVACREAKILALTDALRIVSRAMSGVAASAEIESLIEQA